MAAKLSNITAFYAPDYGLVHLVKRSVSRKFCNDAAFNRQTGLFDLSQFWYYQGQVVHQVSGCLPTGEKWGPLYRGQIIWLNCNMFSILY